MALLLVVSGWAKSSPADEPAATPAVAAPATNGETGKPNGRGRPGPEKPADGAKPDAQKPEGDQANVDKDKPKDKEKDKDKEKSEATPPVRRPTEPDTAPNPAEMKAQPDEQGKVSFSFKGQPWPAVLEWLADVSHMSLDWQEAPGGYLDLTTRRKYTVDEARDMINSILLSKGYTLLRNGEVLIVSGLKNLDVSLVPVVSPQELDGLGNFELVRTYFDLDRLQAETMAEELKPLLSPYGKINALKTTNRIDVLETARTLRRIRDVIGAEQGESGKSHQLREFKLVHARADDALTSLKQLLGMQDKPAGGPMTPEQIQQQMQQQQQMMQQMQQQKEKGGAPQPPGQEPKIYLTINRRENSIMALATPDKLAVIEQAVKLLDVPAESSGSLMGNVQRVQIYRLVGADPGPIVSVLKEMGNLDPTTRLEVDNVNKAILVNGPLVDHLTVRTLIDKLDGSARRFEVIQLRKLDADYVAGSIEFLMRGAQKQDSRPRFFWDGGGSRQQESPKEGAFQVEADTKNNRLLLRANDIELDEIRKLMIKLGEDPFAATSGDSMRVIRSSPGRDTDELLERIKRVWPSISPAPLQVDPGSKSSSSPKPEDKQQDDQKTEEESPHKENPQRQETTTKPSATAGGRLRTAQLVFAAEVQNAIEGEGREPAGNGANAGDRNRLPADQTDVREMPFSSPQFSSADATPSGHGPVSITRGPQGLIITSRDPASLEQMMKLVNELSPMDSRFHVFTLKHTYARDVVTLLEKIFEDDDSKPKERGWSPFWFDMDQPQEKKERNRLNKREPLKFVADSVTNSVLVQNADDEQLIQIRSLVDFYDRADPPDSQSIRKTQIVAIQYSKAQQVADVVKDVYRDLLSPNDKALTSGQPRQEQQRPFYSFFDMGRSSQQGDNVPKFKGLLSIGIDSASNSLVVSAPQFLLTDVVNMIQRLDESTKPAEPVIRVMQVGGLATDPILKEALSNVADPANAKHTASQQSRQDQNNQRNGRWGNNTSNRGNRWGNNNNNQGGGNSNGGNNNNNR